MNKLVLLVPPLMSLSDSWCAKEHLFQTAITELNVSVPGGSRKLGFKLSLKGREGRTCWEAVVGSLHLRQ